MPISESRYRNPTARRTLAKANGSAVELSFQTAELRDICERRHCAVAAFGLACALELERCIADIQAMTTADELGLLFTPSQLQYGVMRVIVHLTTGHRLILCSGHVSTPVDLDGEVVWRSISRIKILDVEAPNV